MSTDENSDSVAEYCDEPFRDYEALRNATEKVLNDILCTDPILSDIPCDISYEEVQSQIALVKGQAITILVERENSPPLKVIVPESNTRVSDLKKAIRRAFDLQQKRLRRKLVNNSTTEDSLDLESDHQFEKSLKNSSQSIEKATTSQLSSTSLSVVDHHHHRQHHYSHHSNSSDKSNNIATIIKNSNFYNTHTNKRISWRYIWRTYLLDNNGQPLIDDNQLLIKYGVVNKTVLKFVKRCRYQQRKSHLKKIPKKF